MTLRKHPASLCSLVAILCLAVFLTGCGGGSSSPDATPAPSATNAEATEIGNVGRPQNRNGIGDVDAALNRYETSRADLVALFREASWFKDGLNRDESLFVERSLAFVTRYGERGNNYISASMIKDKLYVYDKVPVNKGEVELLLIYEPGQDPQREMALIKAVIPSLEALVGVEFPERMMTVVNGAFEINDFNDGQFIRMARCCVASSFVIAHELAHTYWWVGPSWFNEGMADIYATMALQSLGSKPPTGWRPFSDDIVSFYRARKAAVDTGRFPDLALPRRFASDGLYEVADVFLLDLRSLIGPDAFAATAKDIFLTSDFARYNLREKRIEDVFLRHAPASAREDVMQLFNRVVWADNGERYRQLLEHEAP